jgi:hypothetical protein
MTAPTESLQRADALPSNPGTQPGRGEAIVVYRRQDLLDLATDVRAIAWDLANGF